MAYFPFIPNVFRHAFGIASKSKSEDKKVTSRNRSSEQASEIGVNPAIGQSRPRRRELTATQEGYLTANFGPPPIAFDEVIKAARAAKKRWYSLYCAGCC